MRTAAQEFYGEVKRFTLSAAFVPGMVPLPVGDGGARFIEVNNLQLPDQGVIQLPDASLLAVGTRYEVDVTGSRIGVVLNDGVTIPAAINANLGASIVLLNNSTANGIWSFDSWDLYAVGTQLDRRREPWTIDLASSSQQPLGIRATLRDRGWDGVTQVGVTVTVQAGVVRGGNKNFAAINTGVLPVGSTIVLLNHGKILGRGGDGGLGGLGTASGNNGLDGEDGFDALRIEVPTSIANYGLIGGGGGGGAGGDGEQIANGQGGGGGGGGAGYSQASGGAAGGPGSYAGDPGYEQGGGFGGSGFESGAAGGILGAPGDGTSGGVPQVGGAAGNYIDVLIGVAVNWLLTGDQRGGVGSH